MVKRILTLSFKPTGFMHYIFFVILALVWGAGFYMMKLAGFAFGPLAIGATSTLGGAIFLWSFWAISRSKWNIKRQHILPLAFVAFFAYIFPYAAQPFLINEIGHGFIGMMASLVPVLTIIVSIPMLGVFPSRIQLFGVLIGIVGIGLMIVDGMTRTAEPLYIVLAVSVPICYSITNTMIRKNFREVPPIVLVAIFMTSATVVLIPLSLIFEKVTINDRFMTAIVAIFLLSVFARGLGMLLFYRLIQAKGPLFAGLVTYVIPVEALMWSWFDGEHISMTQIAAIAIVLSMVGIVQRDINRRNLKEISKE
jgi:drug/metabolite transporter (DMT)-like permease